MTTTEAIKKIEQEFINKFYEFINDVNTMEERNRDFSMKYGYYLNDAMKSKHGKDTQSNMLWFQSHIFSGKWLPEWIKAGFEKEIIWELSRIGFLSYNYYCNWNARVTGHTDFYYINQATAREIYKLNKR